MEKNKFSNIDKELKELLVTAGPFRVERWKEFNVLSADLKLIDKDEADDKMFEEKLKVIVKSGDTKALSEFLQTAGEGRVKKWQSTGLLASLQLGTAGKNKDIMADISSVNAKFESIENLHSWQSFSKIRPPENYAKSSGLMKLSFKAGAWKREQFNW